MVGQCRAGGNTLLDRQVLFSVKELGLRYSGSINEDGGPELISSTHRVEVRYPVKRYA